MSKVAFKKVKHKINHLHQKDREKKLSFNHFSKINLIFFAIVFVLIGGYFIFKSYAAVTIVPPYKSIWLSQAEILPLPMSGTAWTSVKSVADSNWGSPQLTSNVNRHGSKVYAGALVYARTGDSAYREKVRAAVMSAIGTEFATGPDPSTGTLGVSRNLLSYVVAADLINLENMNSTDATTFRQWLSKVRFTYLPAGRVHSIVHSHQNWTSNWGTMAGASRIGADLYLGDATDLAEAIKLHKSYANRTDYPTSLLPNGVPDSQGWVATYHYFQPSLAFDPVSWGCKTDGVSVSDAYNYVAINPAPCNRVGYTDQTLTSTTTCSLSGANVEDISRDETDKTLCHIEPKTSAGHTYSWESFHAITTQAELLRHNGYENLWTYGNGALRRMEKFIYDMGMWNVGYSEHYTTQWLANKILGTNYPASPASYSKLLGFSDWTHSPSAPSGGTITPPPPTSTNTGDINVDGSVNIFDLSILLSNYGKTVAQSTNQACDINEDNTINIFDLSILLSNYGD
jgi:hypothetical protein